jgi:hypothetical protein
VLDERGIVLARGADGIGGQGIAAAVLAGIGAAVTGSEDHRTGHAAPGEAIRKAEKGSRGRRFLDGPEDRLGEISVLRVQDGIGAPVHREGDAGQGASGLATSA